MCGNIIKGRTDPKFPFFTENGSFWSNCTTKLLAETTVEDRQVTTRNVCNGAGYESVGLFPLKTSTETIGLLQLNDLRKDMFSKASVARFESLAVFIALIVKDGWSD